MKIRIKSQQGFTIIEMMIAMAILAFGILSVVQTYQVGVVQLSSIRLRGQVNECGRLSIEYLTSLPSDYVYSISKGSPTAKMGYDSVNPKLDLKSYVDTVSQWAGADANDCAKLSANSATQLRYQICGSCTKYLEGPSVDNPIPSIESTRCVYDYALRVSWMDPQLGKGKWHYIMYNSKGFSNASGICVSSYPDGTPANPYGCGSANAGAEETVPANGCQFAIP